MVSSDDDLFSVTHHRAMPAAAAAATFTEADNDASFRIL